MAYGSTCNGLARVPSRAKGGWPPDWIAREESGRRAAAPEHAAGRDVTPSASVSAAHVSSATPAGAETEPLAPLGQGKVRRAARRPAEKGFAPIRQPRSVGALGSLRI